ncbi:MAG: hypothetical protein ACR2HN_11795 [Tepidiformaceae bacterium]
MEAVVAGWLAGHAMALLSTAALTFLATRTRATAVVDRWIASEVPRVLVALSIFLGAVIGWTMVGIVLGSLYELGDFASRRNFLGSPSGLFVVIVAALAWLPLAPLIIFARPLWWLWLALCLAFLVLFGWLMPLLAAR